MEANLITYVVHAGTTGNMGMMVGNIIPLSTKGETMPIRIEVKHEHWNGIYFGNVKLPKKDAEVFEEHRHNLLKVPTPYYDCPYECGDNRKCMECPMTWDGLKFAFTDAWIDYCNGSYTVISRLAEQYPNKIRIRNIPNEAVVWEGKSGYQVVFADEEE